MGFSNSSRSSSGSLGGGAGPASTDLSEINDINLTPFVDVVLVLLVIFIVTAPMMMKDVLDVKLPKSSVSDGSASTPLAVAVTKQGQYIVNGSVMTEDALSQKAIEMANQNRDTSVIIAGDIEASHGAVVRVIEIVKSAGLNNFALQIESSKRVEQ